MQTCCIVLNVDTRYMLGAQNLIWSLEMQGVGREFKIIIITSDTAVRDDHFLRSKCDFHFLTQSDKDLIKNIALEFDRPLPNDPINRQAVFEIRQKYFEKFFVFQDFGYKKNLFIDADMLCIGNIDHLLFEDEDCDFRACPALLKSMILQKDGTPKKSNELVEFLLNHFNLQNEREGYVNFNSGLFIAKNDCLSKTFFDKIVNEALTGSFTGDQPVINKVIKNSKLRFKNISPIFNAERPFFNSIDADEVRKIVKQVRLLHYTGHKKPWLHFGWRENEIVSCPELFRIYLEYQAEFFAYRSKILKMDLSNLQI